MKKILLQLIPVLFLTACSGGDATKLIPTNYSALDGWQDDQPSAAFKLFSDSCAVNATRANAYQAKVEGPVGVRQYWERVCSIAAENPNPSEHAARKFFEANFIPYKVETESKATGTLTGYYEPILNGSHRRHGPFQTPVYGVPGDLAKPYYTREEIIRGALKNKAPVLLYVEDPVMLFFLHIQGSGKVRLEDGSLIGLQYAAQNGREFVPIGRVLKERGEMTEVSMQGIRDWLRHHPDQQDEVMNTNPSYVFFKMAPGDQMAKGALGLPLTPLRSVAVDDDRAAYGVPTYIDTFQSEYLTGRQVPLQRLFVSQDTGGALHSPHRGDLFFGRGEVEEWQAGHQNAQGNIYWLLPVAEGVKLRDGVPLTDEELQALPPETVVDEPAIAAPEQAPSPVEQEMPNEDAPDMIPDEIPAQ